MTEIFKFILEMLCSNMWLETTIEHRVSGLQETENVLSELVTEKYDRQSTRL